MEEPKLEEIAGLLREIREGQQAQLERQAEALEIQRRQMALVERQAERTEKIQDRAEQLQARGAQLVAGSRRAMVVILPVIAFLILLVMWMISRLPRH